MTPDQFFHNQWVTERKLLKALCRAWIRLEMLKILETDPVDKRYWARLELTAYEEICRLESKMVRRYL